MTKYSKRMVIIHWLTLVLLIAALVLGGAAHDARHEGSATVMGYLLHAAAGGAILLLTLARLLFRRKDGVPPTLGETPMDKVAKGIHYLLYIVLVLLPVSGMAQIATSDIGKALLSGDMSLLPEKMEGVVAHNMHEALVSVLLVLVAVHLLGALKHQFIMKDGLIDRMSLRKKD